LTKLTAAAEAEIIGTILAASVEINNRCVAVVAVQKKTIQWISKRNRYFAYA
jgi:hypothetical protein